MFLLEYDLVTDYIERRAEFREAHLALATEAAERGQLVLGGALADHPDRALLVWRVADRAIIEESVRGDPVLDRSSHAMAQRIACLSAAPAPPPK